MRRVGAAAEPANAPVAGGAPAPQAAISIAGAPDYVVYVGPQQPQQPPQLPVFPQLGPLAPAQAPADAAQGAADGPVPSGFQVRAVQCLWPDGSKTMPGRHCSSSRHPSSALEPAGGPPSATSSSDERGQS